MRTLLLALLIAAPVAADAQTARDLARLSWASGKAPIYDSAAPSASVRAGSGATARDLARLAWPDGTPAGHTGAPDADVATVTGGTALDLARLVGVKPHAKPVLEAARVALARPVTRPHG
jgi:hypothetical protein